MRAGYALCGTGSGGAIVASTPQAALAAQENGLVALGLGWNEIGIISGVIVGFGGLLFAQYWAWRKHLMDAESKASDEARKEELHQARLAALRSAGGVCDAE